MNWLITTTLTLFIVVAAASASSAASISIGGLVGEWLNPTGGPSNYNTADNPGNNPQVRWGQDTGFGQSGYDLDMAPPPPVPIVHNVPPNTPSFLLGEFTHLNQPITGSAITGIDLRVSFDVSVDGADQGTKFFDFHFAHDETLNGANPCAYAPGDPVNDNGCADRVLVSYLDTSETFSVNRVAYTFDLLGFSTDGGTTIANMFLTSEKLNNTAGLYGVIRAAEDITVPEPATLLLLGTGLAAVGYRRRRKSLPPHCN